MGAITILLCAMLLVVAAVMLFRLHAFLALTAAAIFVTSMTTREAVFLSQVQTTSATVLNVDSETLLLRTPPKWKTQETDFAVCPHDLSLAPHLTLPILRAVPDATQPGRYTIDDPAPASAPLVGNWLIPRARYEDARNLASQTGASRVAQGFGETAMKIGILIAMAAVLGKCLLVSGSAQVIVEHIRAVFGERNTPIAFVVSSFILAIPLFFDTVFLLLLPLAKAMHVQTGRDYLKYVLSIVVGGTLAHSLVPPTPGPLLVAAELELPLPLMFIVGVAIGSVGIVFGYMYLLWANRHLNIPMREDAPSPTAPTTATPAPRPHFALAVLPILLPVIFLGLDFLWPSIQTILAAPLNDSLTPLIRFLGDKNIALTISAFIAFFTLWVMPSMNADATTRHVQTALAEGGTVLLITCAGGAFGAAIEQTNISAALIDTFPTMNSGSGLLVMAFVITALIRFAQGSATVAMITAVGIFAPLAAAMTLPFHPVYLAMAIGCGSKPLAWMNDSGFWVIGKMSGFTEKETFQTFSVLLTIMGLAGFAATLVASMLIPLL